MAGQPWKDSQDGTAGEEQPGRTNRRGQPCHGMTAKEGQLDRTARTGQPEQVGLTSPHGQESQNMIAKTADTRQLGHYRDMTTILNPRMLDLPAFD